MSQAPKPVCFVAMGFGRKAPPGQGGPQIDFDRVYAHIEQAVTSAGLNCVRADFETGGGFIHKPMYERLLIAEYVIADLTFANANVTYEVGVRHGASDRPTILIGAQDHLGGLPFDFRPLRVMPYTLGTNGVPDEQAGAALERGLRARLHEALEGRAPVDNPIMHVTGWEPGGRLEHDKTDVFLDRVEFATELGAQIEAARRRSDREQARAELQEVERILTETPQLVTELHSSLLGTYLAYRDRRAYDRMVAMYPAMPPELRATPVAIEQYALALNRLAEQATDPDEADELRSRALAALDGMDESGVTSETWGIRGRIYKARYGEAVQAGRDLPARALLAQAIEAYESGVRADMRDYYPGVNAVTLRLVRNSPEDVAALSNLVPVVRAAVDYAPPARSDDERYWRTATRLELASAAQDWTAVDQHLVALLGLPYERYMRTTTANNLRIHQHAYTHDRDADAQLGHAIDALTPPPSDTGKPTAPGRE